MLASKARELANEAIRAEVVKREEKAKEYCKGVYASIEELARQGKGNLFLTNLPNDIDAYVGTELRNNGYQVNYINSGINIIW